MRKIKDEQLDLVKLFYQQDIDFEDLLKQNKGRNKKVSSYSLDPYNEELSYEEKNHLLRRTLVGVCKRHLDDLDELTFDQIFDLIFSTETLNEPTNNYYYDKTNDQWNEMYGRDDVAPGETFVNNASTERNVNGDYENGDWVRRQSIQGHILSNIYHQNTSIHWKLFLFLHNLVPTDGGQGIDNKGLWSYYELIFNSCFGSYKEFIFNITLNPAMLVYLNLSQSQKETPDENYAREVQELFTVGKRPFSQFTEDDVREAARLLVGFNVNYDTLYQEGEVDHNVEPWNHDTDNKQFSSFYGNRIIEGKETQEGMLEELDEFVDMLFYPQEAKIYITRRLYQFFVNPLVTSEIESEIIEPLAEVFENNNYSLVETLQVLLKSKHFFDSANYFSIIKSPFDYVFGLYKELDILNGDIRNYGQEENGTFFIPDRLSDSVAKEFTFFGQLNWEVSSMGMCVGEPPSVSGWPPFYQDPVYDMFWINSVTLKSKINCVERACRWGIWMDDGYHLVTNKLDYLFTYQNNEDIDELLDEMTTRLLCMPISASDKSRILLESFNGANKAHWTEIVQKYKSGNESEREDVRWEIESIFERIIYQVFSLGEYNLY